MPFTPTLLVVVGIGVLTLGADLLVRGAAGLAGRIGMSPLVIGLTVVALGTSLPEVAVSVGSAVLGEGEVALGNAIGSNIFNILVVLGGAALIRPLVINRQLVRLDVPVMVVTALLVLLVTMDGALGKVNGVILLTLGFLYTGLLVWVGRHAPDEVPADEGVPTSVPVQLGQLVVGMVLLVLGARVLVGGVTDIARALGVSELVIGLTVVAVGTSLPEVATSFTAAVRGQRDIAVGNAVGSNIFNALIVLGAAGAVAPEPIVVPTGVLTFDLPVMLGVSIACLPIFFTGYSISRWEGAVFVGYYVAYLVYLVLHPSDHAADDVVRDAILFYAAPLTAVTLAVVAAREIRIRRGREDRAGPRDDEGR